MTGERANHTMDSRICHSRQFRGKRPWRKNGHMV